MTNETKNITFHVIHVKVSSNCWCSRTLPMNVAIKSAHCGCERNSCKDWGSSKMCRKHGRIWSNAGEGQAWRRPQFLFVEWKDIHTYCGGPPISLHMNESLTHSHDTSRPDIIAHVAITFCCHWSCNIMPPCVISSMIKSNLVSDKVWYSDSWTCLG